MLPAMELNINSRGNGACPLCREDARCSIQKALKSSTKDIQDPQRMGMELVVYTCPYFKEQF